MTQFFMTSTGSDVTFPCLGNVMFSDPFTDVPIILPNGFITLAEFQGCPDFQTKVDAGDLIITNEAGENVDNPATAATSGSTFRKYAERVETVSTASSNHNYLSLTVDVPLAGKYEISWQIDIYYNATAWAYITYSVDVDGTIKITDPDADGKHRITLYDLTPVAYAGIPRYGAREVTLTEGSHTINLNFGTTSNKSAKASHGMLKIEYTGN